MEISVNSVFYSHISTTIVVKSFKDVIVNAVIDNYFVCLLR